MTGVPAQPPANRSPHGPSPAPASLSGIFPPSLLCNLWFDHVPLLIPRAMQSTSPAPGEEGEEADTTPLQSLSCIFYSVAGICMLWPEMSVLPSPCHTEMGDMLGRARRGEWGLAEGTCGRPQPAPELFVAPAPQGLPLWGWREQGRGVEHWLAPSRAQAGHWSSGSSRATSSPGMAPSDGKCRTGAAAGAGHPPAQGSQPCPAPLKPLIPAPPCPPALAPPCPRSAGQACCWLLTTKLPTPH